MRFLPTVVAFLCFPMAVVSLSERQVCRADDGTAESATIEESSAANVADDVAADFLVATEGEEDSASANRCSCEDGDCERCRGQASKCEKCEGECKCKKGGREGKRRSHSTAHRERGDKRPAGRDHKRSWHPPQGRPGGHEERRGDFPGRPAGHHGYGGPGGPDHDRRGDAEPAQRMRHAMEAVQHLHAAGMHDEADKVEKKVDRFRREMRERGAMQQPGMHAVKRLARALGEMKREIQQLREEVAKIKSSMAQNAEETSEDGDEIAGTF